MHACWSIPVCEVGEGMHACWSIPVRWERGCMHAGAFLHARWERGCMHAGAFLSGMHAGRRTRMCGSGRAPRDANSNQYALSIHSACTQHAPGMRIAIRHNQCAISVQSACPQRAISVHSACNQRAISVPSARARTGHAHPHHARHRHAHARSLHGGLHRLLVVGRRGPWAPSWADRAPSWAA